MSNFEVVQSIIDHWRRKDIPAVLNHVSDDVEYHYLVGQKPLRGKEEMRAFLEKFGAYQTEIQWQILHFAENGDTLLVEGIDDYIDGKERRIRTPYMGIFEFKNGKVRRWRDYLDPALVKRDKTGEDQEEWVEALLARSQRAY